MTYPASRIYLVEGPGLSALSLADCKAYLRVDHDDEDDEIQDIIDAAIAHVDGAHGWLGRALVSQIWDLKIAEFGSEPIELPLAPLIEVQSITYYDEDNNSQTLGTDIYDVVGVGGQGMVYLKSGQSWPSLYDRAEPIAIRFRAGYVTDSSPVEGEIPKPIIRGIKFYCGTLYANRETIVIGQTAMQLPWAAEQLLHPYRIYR